MTILIATDGRDITADLVIRVLNERGVPLVRLDPWAPDTPAQVRISSDGRGVTGTVGTARLEEITAVWWRRPTPFSSGLSDPMAAQWCQDEHKRGLRAALWAVNARWLNHPNASMACTKPAQLVAASMFGLNVPDTLITNDPAAARAFTTEARSITKAFSGPPKSDPASGTFAVSWTRHAEPEEIDDGVKDTGHVFQRRVRSALDVRMTVVGRRRFTAVAPRLELDWRSADPPTEFARLEDAAVPQRVKRGVEDLMDYFGLTYAAFDFAIDNDGAWTFYEMNANGEFGFIEFSNKLSIPEAIADELEGKGTLRPTRNPLHGRTAQEEETA